MRITSDGKHLPREVRDALSGALGDVASECLGQANETCPIETGTLIRSGFAESDGMEAQVAYDTPYAVVQHEDPDYHHDPGRRDHWLSRTVEENRAAYVNYVAGALRRAAR